MKLGLLLVCAVAVLVPSLSESRTVSECELKEKLEEAIKLPRNLERVKDRILSRVVCEVKRSSKLNSNLIRVFGTRVTTTAAPTTVTFTTSAAPTTESTTTGPMSTTLTTSAPTSTTTTTSTTTASTTTATTTATTTNSTASGSRRKREADLDRKEVVPSTDLDEDTDMEMEELLNREEARFDEEEIEDDDNHVNDDDDEESIEESKEDDDGKREKRSLRRHKQKKKYGKPIPWSLGYYGLFQLSDSHFCDSGYRWSRNVCRTSCTAFADDDITDDINCFVKTGLWWYYVRTASSYCRVINVLKDC